MTKEVDALMDSFLAAAQEETFAGFDDSVLKDVFAGPHRRVFEMVYRMGFQTGWRTAALALAATPPNGADGDGVWVGHRACPNCDVPPGQRHGSTCPRGVKETP